MSVDGIAALGGSAAGACLSNLSNFSAECYDVLEGTGPLTGPGFVLLASSVPWRIICLLLVPPWTLLLTLTLVRWASTSIPSLLLSPKAKMKRLPSSFWLVHGRKYDLSSWVKDHPGGAWAIDLGRNRDCTGLFESYHVFADKQKLEKILQRFEVTDEAEATSTVELSCTQGTDGSNQTGLEFGDDFHNDVKQMLVEHFQGRSHKMKAWAGILNILLVLMEAALLWRFWRGSDAALVLLPTVAWLLTCNCTHDGSHFAVSAWPWLNSLASYGAMPLVFPSTCWHIQHVVQHHVYTNDEDDVDLYHFLPVCRTSRFTRWASPFTLQWLSIFAVLPTAVGHLLFIVPVDLLSGQLDAITGTKRYSQCQNLEDLVSRTKRSIGIEFLLCLAFPVLSMYMLGAVEGLRRISLVYSIASYLFIICTQGAHLQGDCMLGKGPEVRSWAKRQAATSINFRPDSYFWLVFTGGLNMQSLHHVAPGISSSHFMELYPKYKKVCEKHGVELKEANNMFEFFRGFLGWIHELAQKEQEQPLPGPPEAAKQ